jgi:uncharacterized protein (TIGR02246 family)
MTRWTGALAAVSVTLIVASCSSPKAPSRKVNVDAELRQATQRYADLVLKMDNAAIAATFTEDGALVNGPQTIRGPKAIQEFLEKFKQFHVQSETLTVQSVTGNSSYGHVLGRYDQTVQLPAGNVVEAVGSYAADWVRGADDVWRISRMITFPEKKTEAPKS